MGLEWIEGGCGMRPTRAMAGARLGTAEEDDDDDDAAGNDDKFVFVSLNVVIVTPPLDDGVRLIEGWRVPPSSVILRVNQVTVGGCARQ